MDDSYTHIVASLILSLLTLIGCACNIGITGPSKNGQYITPNYPLTAKVGGSCTDCDIDSFSAFLDDLDITDWFTCDRQKCRTSSATIPFNSHTLRVEASLSSFGYNCRVGGETDQRRFVVLLPERWVAYYDWPEGNDSASGLAVDSANNLYVTGESRGGPNGLYDYATVKYDGDTGQQLWVARYNAGSWDYARALAVDSANDVYVTGLSRGGGPESNDDYVTIKYDGDTGQQLWIARYDMSNYDSPRAIAVDSADDVFVTGNVKGDIVTVKYDGNTGQQLWVTHYDTVHSDSVKVIAVNNSNDVYVTGDSDKQGGSSDYITIKYNGNTGQRLWVSEYDRAGAEDSALGLAVNNAGEVCVTGSSEDAEYRVDMTTIKYDSNTGQQLWLANYDAGSYDYANAIGVDTAGNFFVTGKSKGSDTAEDYATIKYNGATGAQLWVARYDAGKDDASRAIAVDNSGDIYVTGRSAVLEEIYDFDFTTVKYSGANGQQLWSARHHGGPHSFVDALAVDSAGRIYVTGSRLNNQASDSKYITIAY